LLVVDLVEVLGHHLAVAVAAAALVVYCQIIHQFLLL